MEYKRITIRHPNSDYISISETKQLPQTRESEIVLNRLAELEDKIEDEELVFSKDCSKCKYENNFITQYPCSHCCYCYTGKFEPKEIK